MGLANRNRKANKKKGPSNKRPKGLPRETVAVRSQQWLARQHQKGFAGQLLHRH